MKILVVGGGGREHTLVWKIAQSPKVKKIYCAPGNAGISKLAECVSIGAGEIDRLAGFAKKNKIDLTVVGPEGPLVAGIAGRFKRDNLPVFGPSAEGAQLEGSKVFCKMLMKSHGIPTADFRTFGDIEGARDYIGSFPASAGGPVVKADGLAAGKAVVVAKNKDEALDAIGRIMRDREFGEAGDQVVIEKRLTGEEASILAFADGKTIYPMETSQDHKAAFDGDKGPNTGGMGAYSPAPVVTKKIQREIERRILVPIVHALKREGYEYRGVLYAGLMINEEEPSVLEFNVRFGDPETQPILMRMKSDIVPVLAATVEGKLDSQVIEWDERPAVCVVMASGGYPGSYKKGVEIKGLGEAEKMQDVVVFHAGTKMQEGKIVTNGGRVLGVTALGDTIAEAKERAYEAVRTISFEGAQYRGDISDKAIEKKKGTE